MNLLDRIKNIEIALDKGLPIITSIPEGIKVGGDVYNPPLITSIPEGIKVGGDAYNPLLITSILEGIAVDFTEDSLKKASKTGD